MMMERRKKLKKSFKPSEFCLRLAETHNLNLEVRLIQGALSRVSPNISDSKIRSGVESVWSLLIGDC